MEIISAEIFSVEIFTAEIFTAEIFTAEPSLRSLHCGTFTANSHCGSPARNLHCELSLRISSAEIVLLGFHNSRLPLNGDVVIAYDITDQFRPSCHLTGHGALQ